MTKRIDFPVPRVALEPPSAIARCRSCGADIFWRLSGEGTRPMPLDVASKLDDPDDPSVVRMESHFAHCPHAAQHRRP